MNCTELGPDLVALALGELPPADAARADIHLVSCAPCRAELAATKRLLGAARAVPLAAPPARLEERVLAAVRAERTGAAGHAPPPARRMPRLLTVLVPLAAAAAVLVAIVLAPHESNTAEVIDGVGQFDPGEGLTPLVPANAIRGRFEFREGDEIGAGATAFKVRIGLAPGSREPAAGQPKPGDVEIRLLPAARVRRVRADEIDLSGGTIEVAAGPLAGPFTVTAADGGVRATVKGTRFLATTADGRLVVVVREGEVELGARDGRRETLGAGEQGLVDATRLLRRPADARSTGDTLLTPRISLARADGDCAFEASLAVGEGGPVSVPAFDDATPRFLVSVRSRTAPEREIKLQRSMLTVAPPPAAADGSLRLVYGAPYRIAFSLAGIGLPPGRCEATIRYMSYRRHGDGAEWLGVVESDPVVFEVPVR